MDLGYFQCLKCDEIYVGPNIESEVQCGALEGFILKEGKEVPVGCGGKMKELSKQEAEEVVYNRR